MRKKFLLCGFGRYHCGEVLSLCLVWWPVNDHSIDFNKYAMAVDETIGMKPVSLLDCHSW